MKKTTVCLLGVLLFFCAVHASAQKVISIKPSHHSISEVLPSVESFSKVFVMDDIDVVFSQGTQATALVSGPDNLVSLVRVQVMNQAMSIAFAQPVKVKGDSDLKVFITSPALRYVSVQNDGDFEIKSPLEASDLELHALGLGEISVGSVQAVSVSAHATGRCEVDIKQLHADSFTALAEGKGEIDVAGHVKNASLTNQGAGDIDAEHLKANIVRATLSGSGDISCDALDELNAQANGGGKIKYQGVPTVLNKTGKIKKIQRDLDD